MNINSKKIIFIGDSHTWFFSGDPKAREMQEEAKVDSSRWTPVFTIGSYNSDKAMFMWRIGTTAYSLNLGLLKEIVGDNKIEAGSTIVFNFGAIDLHKNLEKYDNAKKVVNRYVNICTSFANLYKANPIFASPMYNGNSKNYDIFVESLKKESRLRGLDDPLVLVGNIVPREFEKDDEHNHLNKEDSKRCLEYMLSKI